MEHDSLGSNVFRLSLALIFLVYLAGMFIDVIDVDAAQYASMSREMVDSGNFLQVQNRHIDYLDKPPLLFWLSAISFKLFGFSNFAYKLPSVLFTVLGAFSLFRLCRLWYNENVARLSVLILLSCQAWFSFNQDIRTDTLLAAAVIFSIWQLVAYLENGRWLNLVLSGVGLALAMLSKGPIGIMVPALAVGSELLLKRRFKAIFDWRWLVMLAITGVLLIPMLWGLYQQFDLHPEKVVNGKTGVSGIRFYFWEQSFGRITGENVWKNDAGYFFFIHTYAWAFMPWILLGAAGLIQGCYFLFSKKKEFFVKQEFISLAGVLLPFIALSMSKFKLPHYIFIVFPLWAILTARFVHSIATKYQKWFSTVFFAQLVIALIAWLVLVLLNVFSFPESDFITWLAAGLFLILSIFFTFPRHSLTMRMALPSMFAIVAVNFMLNMNFYPRAMEYQTGNSVARKVLAQQPKADNIYTFKLSSHSLDFYARDIARWLNDESVKPYKDSTSFWIYTNDEGLGRLKEMGMEPLATDTLEHFKVALMKIEFLKPAERHKVLRNRYLLKY